MAQSAIADGIAALLPVKVSAIPTMNFAKAPVLGARPSDTSGAPQFQVVRNRSGGGQNDLPLLRPSLRI